MISLRTRWLQVMRPVWECVEFLLQVVLGALSKQLQRFFKLIFLFDDCRQVLHEEFANRVHSRVLGEGAIEDLQSALCLERLLDALFKALDEVLCEGLLDHLRDLEELGDLDGLVAAAYYLGEP